MHPNQLINKHGLFVMVPEKEYNDPWWQRERKKEKTIAEFEKV